MNAKRTLFAMLTLCLIFTAIGCGNGSNDSGNGGNGDDLTVSDLAGDYTATEFEFTNNADSSQSFDLIAEGGTFNINVESNGDYTTEQTFPGEIPETDSGVLTLEGLVLTVNSDSDEDDSILTLIRSSDGNTLTLTNLDNGFDFDDNGVEESATLLIVLQKD